VVNGAESETYRALRKHIQSKGLDTFQDCQDGCKTHKAGLQNIKMNPRQPYAPTPHSYVPNTTLSATINLDEVQWLPNPPKAGPLYAVGVLNWGLGIQEVKLADTHAERDLQDSLAEIFSIIVTIDQLEKAFLKDAIPETEYTGLCERALKQYNALVADETVAKAFVGLEEFKAEWGVRIFLLSLP